MSSNDRTFRIGNTYHLALRSFFYFPGNLLIVGFDRIDGCVVESDLDGVAGTDMDADFRFGSFRSDGLFVDLFSSCALSSFVLLLRLL